VEHDADGEPDARQERQDPEQEGGFAYGKPVELDFLDPEPGAAARRSVGVPENLSARSLPRVGDDRAAFVAVRSSIAVGEGAVWVLNGNDNTVSRIDSDL
jgi:hypothetical protein